MKRLIEVSKEEREFLMKAFNVSGRMIGYALSYDSTRGNSELATKIRHLAIKRGGKVMLYVPQCETIFTAEGNMVQTFDNGYELFCNMKSSSVDVRHKGVTLRSYTSVTIPMLEEIQMEVQNIRITQSR